MELEATVHELAPRLLRYSLALTADRALGEEAAQDALSALVQRWRRWGPPEDAAAFVFSIARRRAGRLLWQRRLLTPLGALFNGATAPSDPEAEAAARHELQRTLAALTRLSKPDREALELVALGELSTAQGAAVLGCSEPALKMRLHRARKRLTSELEDSSHGTRERS